MPTSSTASIWRAIAIATTIAGTLDLLAAFILAVIGGGSPIGVLRGVGSAVVDADAFDSGAVPALIGLALHFAIMLVMASVYIVTASRIMMIDRRPVFGGIGYGSLTWLVMYWLVLPQRWPTLFPILDPKEIAIQLFCHIVLVGIPIALVSRRARRWI
ncbi:putative membrane protein YagU involved in acid resistance [Sphingomonas sp. UYAg733]